MSESGCLTSHATIFQLYIGRHRLLVVLRIYIASAVFQPYCDLEAGDNQSLKIQVARPGIEPPGPLALQAKSLTTWHMRIYIIMQLLQKLEFKGTYAQFADALLTRIILFRDWILLVCFSWRYEATEVPRVNFVMARSAFRNLHVDPLSLHNFMRNKQVEINPYIYTLTTLSKLYRFGYEISVF